MSEKKPILNDQINAFAKLMGKKTVEEITARGRGAPIMAEKPPETKAKTGGLKSRLSSSSRPVDIWWRDRDEQ